MQPVSPPDRLLQLRSPPSETSCTPARFCSKRACACLQAAQAGFFAELLPDVLGFAGAVMIRRILGIAHVIDFEQIADADTRYAW